MVGRRVLVATLALASCGLAATSVLARDDDAVRPLPEARSVFGEAFASSRKCALCHSNSRRAHGMRDAEGRRIAPFDLWRSSMMANSTRDPLWRAVVSVEVAATPSKKALIEAKCLRCHAPMASTEASLLERKPIALSLLRQETDPAQLALDGVSCTACHQIRPDGLGASASYSGRYVVREGKTVFGPHADPFGMPMRRHTGYTPKEGPHVRASAMCATCHTLFTDALDASGEPTGRRLPEQTPYLEWRNSVFNDEVNDPDRRAASCQACHAPTRDADGVSIETRIARNPGGRDFPIAERSPFGRHVFVGGNTLVPGMLHENAATLRPLAPREALDATITQAREQLTRKTARVSIGDVKRTKSGLRVPVRVENLTGHKFPTGHPTRRAWLRLRVLDASGRVVWASGEHDTRGRIVGADGSPLSAERLGGDSYPHRTEVTAPEQVQVYESLMADAAGKPTHLLLRGGSYLKDSRLLPLGWKPDHRDAEHTRPHGVGDDADFGAGCDSVVFVTKARPGTLRVEATLLYQTFGARYAAEVFAYETPEVRELRGYYARADKTPVTVAHTSMTVE